MIVGGVPMLFGGAAVADDPHAANVVLHLIGAGSNGSQVFTDSSPSPKTITVAGDAQISTARSKLGSSSMLFDGTGDYAYAADSVDWNFGAGSGTIEAWLYVASGTPALRRICGQATAAGGFGVLLFGTDGSGHFQAASLTSDEATYINCVSTTIAAADTWYKVSWSVDAVSARLHVNGILEATVARSGLTFYNSAEPLHIGRSGSYAGGFYWVGNAERLRITKGIARYSSANYDPLTVP